MKYIPFAILTGGKSQRFGNNKLNYSINGKKLLQYVIDSLPIENPIYTIGYPYLNGTIPLKDIIPNIGPIGGIYSALKLIDSEKIFILAGDLPLISYPLIDYMVKISNILPFYDVYVPINNGFYEPLFAIYSQKVLPMITQQITENKYKISTLFAKVNLFKIDEKHWRIYDPNGYSFINVNYKKDIEIINEISKKNKNN